VPFNEAPFLTAAKAEVDAIRIAVATAISFLGVVFIWFVWLFSELCWFFELKIVFGSMENGPVF
jgi:hypothetical protein